MVPEPARLTHRGAGRVWFGDYGELRNVPRRRGNMWASSAQAETTVPVGPTACLKITPGKESFKVELADAALVADINLRTYGWSDIAIFGTNEQALRDVHDEARAHPASVPRPVAPVIHADCDGLGGG